MIPLAAYHRPVLCALAVLVTAIGMAGSATAAKSPYRDPYLGNRIAFTVPDQRAGCVAGLYRQAGVTCDSTVAAGVRKAPASRPGTPPAPAGCALGWGVRYHLPPSGKARGQCASTWVGSGHHVLRQGKSLQMRRGIRCRARGKGLRCVNRTGNGFTLTTTRVTLF